MARASAWQPCGRLRLIAASGPMVCPYGFPAICRGVRKRHAVSTT